MSGVLSRLETPVASVPEVSGRVLCGADHLEEGVVHGGRVFVGSEMLGERKEKYNKNVNE